MTAANDAMSNVPRVTRAKFVPGFGLVAQWSDGDITCDSGRNEIVARQSTDPDGLIAKALFGEDEHSTHLAVDLLRSCSAIHDESGCVDRFETWRGWLKECRAYLATLDA